MEGILHSGKGAERRGREVGREEERREKETGEREGWRKVGKGIEREGGR